MKIEGAIEKFALSVAIGALLLLGMFLIVKGNIIGFLKGFEGESSSSILAMAAAIPAITIAYILGAFVQVISDLVVQIVSEKAQIEEWQALEKLARSESETLAAYFEELRRSKKLLEGCLGPLLFLAFGLFVESGPLSYPPKTLLICAIITLLIACGTPYITGKLHRAMILTGYIADSIQGLNPLGQEEIRLLINPTSLKGEGSASTSLDDNSERQA